MRGVFGHGVKEKGLQPHWFSNPSIISLAHHVGKDTAILTDSFC